MIVEALLTVLFGVVELVISFFHFPDLPANLMVTYKEFLPYFNNALDFVFFLFNKSVLIGAFNFLIGLWAVTKVIDLFGWILSVFHGDITAGSDE